MADLEEIKTINADLPLTTFPNEIDGLESFSDADDEINSAIIMYKNYIKQGETSKAEEVYEKYSLKKYIVSAYFLNKIQQMIIACERAISSVKKYFTFSVEQPTSTTVQPNGYIWGKILSVGDNFKKVLFKLKENDTYIDIYPQTTSDNVLLSEEGTETVKDNLDTLNTNIDTKMDKSNPTGTGSFAMNLGDALIGGDGFNSVSLGTNNTSVGKNSMAFGAQCQVLTNNAIAEGLGLVANVANQHVSGKYNASGDFAQIIGGGNSNEDRKNIYTVDWNGNVKGNSFTATGDIIFNGNQSLDTLNTNHKALKEFSEAVSRTVVNHDSSIDTLTESINTLTESINSLTNKLGNLRITELIKDKQYVHGTDIASCILIIATHTNRNCSGIWTARMTSSNQYCLTNISNDEQTGALIDWYCGDKTLMWTSEYGPSIHAISLS